MCKRSLLLLWVVLHMRVGAIAAQAEDRVYKFDFGWKELVPPQGFLKVTKESLYAKDKGFGFAKELAWGSGPFPYVANACHKHLEEIGRDGVRVIGSFVVDVPNGNYLVWYLEGDLGAYALQPMWNHLGYGLTIEGKELHKAMPWDKELMRKEYFRGMNDDYRRGEDIFEKFVTPLMDDKTVEVTVTDEQLTIEGNAANLCGLVVYPSSMKAQFDEEVARIRKHRRDFFYSVVNVREPKEEGQPAPVSEADKQRGYQVWPRHKMRVVSPQTQPEAEELSDTIKAYAAQGQTETVTFAVRPLVDLKAAQVTVTDLVSPEGGRIAKESVAVRILFYRVGPEGEVLRSHLPPLTTADLPAAITKQFWLTFTAPSTAKPGIYAGKVTFRAAGHPETSLSVKVRILNFSLKDTYREAQFVTQCSGAARYTYQMQDLFPGELVPATVKVFHHHRDVGLLPQISDIVAKTIDAGKPTQRVELNPFYVKEFCDLVDEYVKVFPGVPVIVALHRTFAGYWTPVLRGPNGWGLSQQPDYVWAAFKEYVQGYERLRKEHPTWPEFYYIIGAEMSNGGEDHVLFGKRCIEVAKSIPGVKVITCPNGAFEARTYAPLVDIIAPNFAVRMTDEGLKGIPNDRTKLWVYQAFNRFCYGFYMARVKGTGSFKEFYCTADQRPYNEFDGKDLWINCALPTPDGMVSMPIFEEFGWGATDYRYIKTLEDLIALGKRSRKPKAVAAAKDAERFLTNLLDEINPDLDYYVNQAGWWDFSVYDIYRWQVAEKIMNLKVSL